MAWQKPQTFEIKMDAELTSYQGDDDLPWLAVSQAAVVDRLAVRIRTLDDVAHGRASAMATPHGAAPAATR